MSDAPFAFLPRGAILQSFVVGGTNIVQGFPTTEGYEANGDPYFGETIGRVANRIGGARLNSVNGRSYALAANNGPNNLHGGDVGWGKKDWAGPTPVGVRQIPGVEGLEGGESVRFALTSDDGDEGFPGKVEASVVYTAGTQKEGGREVVVLGIEYEAELVSGADETPINMTNHSCVHPELAEARRADFLLATSTCRAPRPSRAPSSRSSPTATFPSTTAASRRPAPPPLASSRATRPSRWAPRSPTSTTASS